MAVKVPTRGRYLTEELVNVFQSRVRGTVSRVEIGKMMGDLKANLLRCDEAPLPQLPLNLSQWRRISSLEMTNRS